MSSSHCKGRRLGTHCTVAHGDSVDLSNQVTSHGSQQPAGEHCEDDCVVSATEVRLHLARWRWWAKHFAYPWGSGGEAKKAYELAQPPTRHAFLRDWACLVLSDLASRISTVDLKILFGCVALLQMWQARTIQTRSTLYPHLCSRDITAQHVEAAGNTHSQ